MNDKEKERYLEIGNKCSLWGRNVPDMSRDELIVFIGYLDELATMRYLSIHGAGE